MSTALAKKTKTELLEEYNKLLTEHEDFKRTAQLVNDPQSIALLAKVDGYTVDQLTQSIAALKSSVNATLQELTDKLITEAQKFGELQKAIALAKNNLELHYHIQVTVDTIARLIEDHKAQTIAREEEIITKRRDWTREQEAHEYAVNVQRQRSQEEFEELKTKQERALAAYTETLKREEHEITQLRTHTTECVGERERLLAEREAEVVKRLRHDFDAQMTVAKKDWNAQESIFKMESAHREERIKTLTAENAASKGEVERAHKRVQELAVTIIEGGARAPLRTEEKKPSPPAPTTM